MQLTRRAERNPPERLVSAFVEPQPLLTVLSSDDHQVIYGRRGTGKTHALHVLADRVRSQGHLPIIVDMRALGSSGALYANAAVDICERGTRLLVDALTAVQRRLQEEIVSSQDLDLSVIVPLVDELAGAICETRVVGDTRVEESENQETVAASRNEVTGFVSTGGLGVSGTSAQEQRARERYGTVVVRTGVEQHNVVLGDVQSAFRRIADSLEGRRLWVLLDEWSDVPADLQPLLADLLRRSLLPTAAVTVKIAAIQERCSFRAQLRDGGYVGFEVGADLAPDVDVDDYLVFENDQDRAREFFADLLFRHVRSWGDSRPEPPALPSTKEQFVTDGFTRPATFDELVRAAEGVPRDAMNVALLAAQKALDRKISMQMVRDAAMDWYQRDKGEALRANPRLDELLRWILQEVLEGRRCRGFLLEQGQGAENSLVRALHDERVLHVIKRGVSSRDFPGARFDVYSIDYGCYVDLMRTGRRPQGLFLATEIGTEEDMVAVPADNYRTVRGAVLNLEDFDRYLQEQA